MPMCCHYVANTCISPWWNVELHLNRFEFHYVCFILSMDRICPVALDMIFLPTWISIIHGCQSPWDVVPRKIGLNSYKPGFINCELIYG